MKIRWWKPWGLIVILMLLMISMGYAEAQETFVREFDHIQSACSLESMLYAWTEDGVFAYDAITGIEKMHEFQPQQDKMREGCLFINNGELYALVRNELGDVLYGKIALSEEYAEVIDLHPVNWSVVQPETDTSEEMWPRAVVACEGIVVFTLQQDWNAVALFSLDLTNGMISQIADAQPTGLRIASCGDQGILMQKNGFQVENTENELAMYDPVKDELIRLDLPEAPQLTCMVATHDGQNVYYLDGNRLMRFDLLQGKIEECGGMINDGSFEFGFLMGDKWYAAVGSHKIAACSIGTDMVEQMTYYYCSNRALEAEERFFADGVAVNGVTGEALASKLTEMMLNGDSQIDVFIVSADSEFYRAARDRGYALPISSSELLSSAAQAMYPAVSQQLMNRDGELIAIPVSTLFDLPALNCSAMERLGLAQEDIPLNWLDFLCWLDQRAPFLSEKQITLFPQSISAESARWRLISCVLSSYQLYFSENPSADLEILHDLLKKIERMDSTRFGLIPQSELSLSEDDTDNEENSLFYPWFNNETLGYLLDDGVSRRVYPLCMALSPEYPAYLKVNAEVAVVNPHTRHPERAIQWVETLWSCASPEVAVTIQPENNVYIEFPDFKENAAFFESYLEELEAQLESAQVIDQQPILDRIADIQIEYDRLTQHRWAVDDETLDWLRLHDEHIVLSEYIWLRDTTTFVESELATQYKSGLLALDQFVDRLDTQVRMMRLEG